MQPHFSQARLFWLMRRQFRGPDGASARTLRLLLVLFIYKDFPARRFNSIATPVTSHQLSPVVLYIYPEPVCIIWFPRARARRYW